MHALKPVKAPKKVAKVVSSDVIFVYILYFATNLSISSANKCYIYFNETSRFKRPLYSNNFFYFLHSCYSIKCIQTL